MILVVGTLIAKVISACFKIPLQHLIGDDGMGVFNVAYQFYTAMFVIATAGVPVALSKMIAESAALGRAREVRRIAGIAGVVFVSFGALCSLAMYAGAASLTQLIQNPLVLESIRAIAPAVFFVSVIAVVRGYYQGLSNMTPTAASQIIEAAGKVLLGLGLAAWAMSAGMEMTVSTAFAILGITIGEAAAALFMLGYALHRGRRVRQTAPLSDACRPVRTLAGALALIVIPVTLTNSVMSLTTLVDSTMVVARLRETGFTLAQANELFGVYTGKAFTMFNFPQTLITALSTAVLPAVAGAYAQQNFTQASRTMGSAMRIAMLIALPAGVGYFVLSEPIIALLFKGDPALGAGLLQILSLAIPFVALVGLSNAILQAIGQVQIPVVTMLLGGLTKIVLNHYLVGRPEIHIYGAPCGTVACYALIATLNLLFLRQRIALPGVDRMLIRPLAACAGMGACALIAYRLLAAPLGGKLAVLAAIGVAGVVYIGLLLALHALAKEDVLLLPGGKKLVKMLRIE